MPFMQAEICLDEFAEATLRDGSSALFPADLLPAGPGDAHSGDRRAAPILRAAADFVECASERNPVVRVIIRETWAGRLSAFGYMDSTEWTPGSSIRDVAENLLSMYGEDDGETDECAEDIISEAERAGLSETDAGELRARWCLETDDDETDDD